MRSCGVRQVEWAIGQHEQQGRRCSNETESREMLYQGSAKYSSSHLSSSPTPIVYSSSLHHIRDTRGRTVSMSVTGRS